MTVEIPEPIFISAPKAANLCGVSRNTICCWIRDGKLPSYRTAGGKYLIRPSDLSRFMTGSGMFVPQALQDLASTDELTGNAPTQGKKSAPEGSTILVVDDDAAARELAVRTLKKLDHTIIEAENGYEAMHLLTKHPGVSLVVLDLVMPGQDGAETFQQIREKHGELPVLIVTGYPPENAEEVFGDHDPDLVITKPYQPANLYNAAATLLATE